MSYAIATFCYGERYYNQTNRLIKSFDELEEKSPIFIVTDNPDALEKREYVFLKNISDYKEKHLEYANNYYDFDFSVKRFSLLFAFENKFNNVILTDTDVLPNDSLYNYENVMRGFVENSVAGQVTYNFENEQNSNSMLGNRFKYYEDKYQVKYDRSNLTEMAEDCIQFISIEDDLKFKFIQTWSDCIKIKDEDGLPNAPAGNIDEMCFSALYNGLRVVNNSAKAMNLLVAHHDKWY